MTGRQNRAAAFLVGVALATLGLASCKSIGPHTIPRDRFDYGAAISNSWKEQILNNIIRLRYVEAPVFVDVASVINQYSLEGEIGLGGGWNSSALGGNTASVGGVGRWSDRPTITYNPVSGRKFAVSLLTPISPENIFALVQSGWPAELILRLTVKTINGVENEAAAPANRRTADPRYVELIQAWNRLRKARALGLRKDTPDKGAAKIVVYHTNVGLEGQVAKDLEFIRNTLGLDPDAEEYTLTYGIVPDEPNEICVLTSSIIEIMNELAWRAAVPPLHIEEGRTGRTFEGGDFPPLIRMHWTTEEPEDQYVAVKNRNHWFYIDDRDVLSKRTFAILQILFSLTESGEAARGPVVTIGS